MMNKFVSQKTALMLVLCMLLSSISGFSLIIGPSGTIGVSEGVANATNPPTVQSSTISSDAKTFRVTFNQELEAVDKSKISISLDGKTNLASTAYNATIEDKYLLLTFVSEKATFKNNGKITILKGAVVGMDSGADNEEDSVITVNVSKFVSLGSATMNNTNNQANLSFATTVKGVNVGSVAVNPALQTLDGQIETSVDGGKTWSAADVESAALEGNTLEVYFYPALTNSKTLVRVKAGTLSYTATGKHNGVLNAEIKTVALDLFPVVASTTLSADNKVISVKYSENILTATSPAPAKGASDSTLLGKIRLATDGENFTIAPASVAIAKDTLTVTFSIPLVGDGNILKINEDAVQDTKKNKSAEFISNNIVADESEPVVLGLGFNKADKTLTVYFNENISLFGSTTLATLASGLKYNDTSQFTQPVVTINKNTLVIKHKTTGITTTGTGGVVNVVIPKESIRDAAVNENVDAITTVEPDIAAPVVEGYSLSNSDRDITIEFNEYIYAGRAIPLAALSITTGSGQSAVTKNLADKSWKAANTTVTIVGGNLLKISNLSAPFPIGSTFTINKDIITDITLNKNILHQFVLYRTVEEGIQVLNTADAAYAEQQNILNRIRELAVQAVDHSITSADRTALQTEIVALTGEMNRIATTTTFNSVVLIGATPYTLRIATGEMGSLPMVHTFVAATPTALGINALSVSNPADAVTSIESIDAALDTITDARMAIGDTLDSLYE